MHHHVVLGASGAAGRAITQALVEAGESVTTVSRGTSDLSAPHRRLDVTDPRDAGAAVADATVVYMAAQPPYHRWAEEFPAMLETVVTAAAAQEAKLVMVDNLYAYGPGPQPMSEGTPQRATDKKGSVRARMADALLASHEAGRLRVSIGRASDYFGPHCENSGISALTIEPARRGKTLRWMANQDVEHSCAFLPDIARGYVTLGLDDRADGRIWHLPHAPAVTGREFLATVNRVLPKPLKTATLPIGMLRLAAPFHRISRESLDIAYQWKAPFVVDDTAFRQTFGPFDDTALAQAVADTLSPRSAAA